MIVLYLRSSSIGTYKQCEQKYFISYVLNIPEKPHLKTVKGTILHKVLECYAKANLAQKNKQSTFHDDQLGELKISDIDLYPELCFDLFESDHPNLSKLAKANGSNDLLDIKVWLNRVLEMNNGAFNPLNLDIISSEIQFDIPVEEEWAKTEDGYLSLKGTIDLVTRHDDYIEIIDWKTGQRKNWVTNEPKDLNALKDDHQTKLYAYAIKHLYQSESYGMTYVWLNDGGAFTIPFDKDYFEESKNMIRNVFENIKNNTNPALMTNKFFCKTFCYYGKNSFEKPSKWKDGNPKTMCAQIKGDTMFIGIDEVMKKYMKDDKHLRNYGNAAGRSERKL